jgi:hypothetical protein
VILKVLMATGFALAGLCACVEVRKKDEGQESKFPPVIQLVDLPSVQINEPMYVYDGKILNSKDMELEIKINEVSKKTAGHDFEFTLDELTITEKGSLYTLGNNVRIHVRNINIESGLISTFPEGQTAELGKNGRAGGHLLVDVQEGAGVLKIVMRGEAGGQGFPGAAPDDAMKGSKGNVCESYTIVMDWHGPDPHQDWEATKKLLEAASFPGSGTKGKLGGSGASGGDSGTLELKIRPNSNFTFAVERSPGRGGVGGQSGEGGEIGEYGVNKECRDLLKYFHLENKLGKRGEPGEAGKAGPSGSIQTYCLNRQDMISCL